MAPSFLSKFVNRVNSSSTHGRGSSTSSKGSAQSSRRSSAQDDSPKKDHFNSAIKTPVIITVDPVTPQRQSYDSTTSDQPNFTVIPPSPHSIQASLISSHSDHYPAPDNPDRRIDVNSTHKDAGELSTLGRTTSVTNTPTPATPSTARQQDFSIDTNIISHSRPSTPSSTDSQQKTSSSPPPPPMPPSNQVRPSASNRSLNVNTTHARAATSPETTRDTAAGENGNIITVSPIVESPTALKAPEFPSMHPYNDRTRNATLSVPKDSDAVSLMSTTTNSGTKDKKRPWRKSTTRKPSGLAGAIAASGMAMAHPTLSTSHQHSFNAAAAQAHQIASSTSPTRKSSNPGSPPYATRSPPGSSNHIKGRSADLSPRSAHQLGSLPRRRPSTSIQSDNSDYYPEDRPEYFSGLDASSDEDEDSDSSDLLAADLGMDDMPVTGFAVASYKRNSDFHELFPTIPEGDYLIEDYGCALQREILIQGRLYISENHICFHANIFGWITDLSIPTYEITSLEKKMTAFVIPNAIQITTRQAKYTFASFLSRDTTYDVIHNIWRLARPDDVVSIRPSIDESGFSPSTAITGVENSNTTNVIRRTQEVTQCSCSNHYSETAMDCIVPGSPDRIQNLMFASGFIKEFMAVDQKLIDIQISDWQPTETGSNLLARNMSYIKPLNASLGPKQTKCEIRDEMVHNDPEQFISTVTTTRTPDVPSGGVFSVKTRTCLMWASPVSTRILITTQVEWTGRSFIRSIIERSAIDGQKTYHNELETAMRKYIQEHQSEFVPEGIDASVLSPDPQFPTSPNHHPSSSSTNINTSNSSTNIALNEKQKEEEAKRREQERNQRGLQWAYDTFEGALEVAKRSTKGALELIRDAWEQSSSITIMWFVIVALVLSNLWSITMMGSKEEIGRRKEMKKMEEREKWVQGVVTALWDELGKKQQDQDLGNVKVDRSVIQGGNANGNGNGMGPLSLIGLDNWKREIGEIERSLDQIEQRVKSLKGGLKELHDGLETNMGLD